LLGQYKFKILYTLGKDNGRADALSRRTDHMESKDITEKPILKQEKDGSLVLIQSLAATIRITVQDIAPTLKEGYVNDKLVLQLRN